MFRWYFRKATTSSILERATRIRIVVCTGVIIACAYVRVRMCIPKGEHTHGARRQARRGVEGTVGVKGTSEIICGVTGDYVCLSTKPPSAFVRARSLFFRFCVLAVLRTWQRKYKALARGRLQDVKVARWKLEVFRHVTTHRKWPCINKVHSRVHHEIVMHFILLTINLLELYVCCELHLWLINIVKIALLHLSDPRVEIVFRPIKRTQRHSVKLSKEKSTALLSNLFSLPSATFRDR